MQQLHKEETTTAHQSQSMDNSDYSQQQGVLWDPMTPETCLVEKTFTVAKTSCLVRQSFLSRTLECVACQHLLTDFKKSLNNVDASIHL